jgi:hypothetical protein
MTYRLVTAISSLLFGSGEGESIFWSALEEPVHFCSVLNNVSEG